LFCHSVVVVVAAVSSTVLTPKLGEAGVGQVCNWDGVVVMDCCSVFCLLLFYILKYNTDIEGHFLANT
jgi:hypothetical protein